MLINIHQAKTQLSKLVVQVNTNQEEIIIGKAGTPVAKLIAYIPPTQAKPGILKGKIKLDPDFDAEDATINQLFYANDQK